ncbi:MAG: primosomal protein N' [bacterium]|nr:primosomal protein N' [bacterium]
MAHETFVQVAFPLPVEKTFTYILPPSLQERVAVGSRVRAPFGSRLLSGLVTEVRSEPPPERGEGLKAVDACLDDEPLVGRDLLVLARWVAEYYCAGLGEVLKAALPAGGERLAPLTHRVVRLVDGLDVEQTVEALRSRSPVQARLVEALADGGERPRAELRRLAPGADGAVKALRRKGLIEEEEREVWRRPAELATGVSTPPPALTASQERALVPVAQAMDEGVYQAFLLHGVTGSGKTEIYLRAIGLALERGRSACVLVPEIALTPQLVQRFEDRFPGRVGVLHSGLSPGERYDQWRGLRAGRASICIGARSAVFAPLRDLGVVVVDEEHDGSYKQEESPRYHAREVALVRAREAGAVAILGSATPSLESRHNVDRNKLALLELPDRIEGRPLPNVEVVDLRGGEGSAGAGPVIWSPPLAEALRARVARGEQALVLLNRRGFANVIQCVDCGYVFGCANCSVSLTYHASHRAARCHWCDATVRTIRACPECNGALFHYGGLGTQRVEEEVKKLVPGAVVARMDRDTTSRRGAYLSLLGALGAGEIDVLVGTQMIAKGHDYPNITLVGVVSADTSLHVPDFRAAERTFQLLTQVAGRTGRGEAGGEVIVQTYMPDHYAIAHAVRHDYAGFYAEEMARREAVGWPPFTRLALLRLEGARKEVVEDAALALAEACRKEGQGLSGGEVLGPAWAPVARVRNRYRRQLVLKNPSARRLNAWVRSAVDAYRRGDGRARSSVALKIDIDPVSAL